MSTSKTKDKYRIAVVPGDGIGREVMQAAIDVLDSLDIDFDYVYGEAGDECLETTPDLRYAKVYVSFLEEAKAKDAMKGLQSAGGWLRREVGNELKLRYTPELVWALDDSITYGAKMLEIINNLPYGNHDDEE